MTERRYLSYRWQLEAFVDKVKGREPHAWICGDDSVKQAEAVEAIYAKVDGFVLICGGVSADHVSSQSGLGLRPPSTYRP
jgi:hypothetical protein